MEEPEKRERSLKVPSQPMRMLVSKYTPCMRRCHFEQSMDSSSWVQDFSRDFSRDFSERPEMCILKM